MTNDGDEDHQHGIGQMFQALLDPARVVGLFDIEITGHGQRAGHPVICAVWRPRALTDHDDFALHQLGSGAQEHAIEVDAERGNVLREELAVELDPPGRLGADDAYWSRAEDRSGLREAVASESTSPASVRTTP